MGGFTIKTWIRENKKAWHIWLTVIMLSLAFTALQYTNKKEEKPQMGNVDTYIPTGFVLAPVELSNGPSLYGLLESKGVVDLYTGDPNRKKVEKVAEAVKIIRSPRDPSYFAVLVPENKAPFLIQRFQAFHAVVQNPRQHKPVRIKPLNKKKRRKVIIELDKPSDF